MPVFDYFEACCEMADMVVQGKLSMHDIKIAAAILYETITN